MEMKRSHVSSLNEIEGKPAKVPRTGDNIIIEDVELDIADNSNNSGDGADDGGALSEEEPVVLRSTNQTSRRQGFFKLSEKDVQIIITRKEITDHIIGAAHCVLHKQFPDAVGLENTTLGLCSNFSVHKKEFSQILHTSTHHWVLVSNIGCKPSTINLYDSLCYGRLTSFVKKQIAGLLLEQSPSITVNIQPVQQQSNSVDCGVFAIAFLVSILFNQDPTCHTFNLGSMRQHLLKCLHQDVFEPFPMAKQQVQWKSKPKSVKLPLMCSCRMPWNQKDLDNPDLWCAQCESCSEWFHKKCSPTMPDAVFQIKYLNWVCLKCEQ